MEVTNENGLERKRQMARIRTIQQSTALGKTGLALRQRGLSVAISLSTENETRISDSADTSGRVWPTRRAEDIV